MSDRRRTTRFVPEHTDGVFCVLQDVFVEHVRGKEIVVLMDAPLTEGEELMLEMPRERGRRSLVRVRAVSSTVVPFGTMMRHRVGLQVIEYVQSGAKPVMVSSR